MYQTYLILGIGEVVLGELSRKRWPTAAYIRKVWPDAIAVKRVDANGNRLEFRFLPYRPE